MVTLQLGKRDKRLLETLMFLIRFLLLSIPLYLILILDISLLPLQHTVSGSTLWLLKGMGFTAHSEGLIMYVGDTDPFIFYTGPDCTGWKSMLCFLALVLATMGVTMKKRLFGILAGIPLIYIGNLARIVGVVVIEDAYGLETAMVIHDWLWQAGLIALVLVLWFAWLKSEGLKKHIIALREK
jgi:exosortase/archaeosortase family protein